MRKRNFVLVVMGLIMTISVITIMLTTELAQAQPQKKFVWKFQNEFPAADTANFITSKMWKEGIEKAANGRITIELYEPDAIVPALEMESAIKKGVLDSGMGPAYGPGLVIGGIVAAGFPGQFTNMDDAYKLIHELGLIEIARKAYAEQNLYFLCSSPAGSIFFMTNFPIRRANDLKGKKLHSSGMRAKWMSALGASVVTLPGSELYMAMKLGTVDGITYTGSELESMKLMEVVKYVSLPSLYITNNVFTVNLAKWKELPDDLKTALNNWSKTELKTVGKALLDYQQKALDTAKKYGVQFIELPKQEIEKSRAMADESTWATWAKQDKFFAEGVKIVKDYYAKKR